MLWIKAFHIIFVVSWFASLLYLPRLLVYHCDVEDEAGHARYCLMEKRLYSLGSIAMVGTWLFGIALLMHSAGFLQQGWLQAKLVLVLGLSGYHGWLKGRLRAFANKTNSRDARFYRIINEVPAVIMVAVVILVVVKPF